MKRIYSSLKFWLVCLSEMEKLSSSIQGNIFGHVTLLVSVSLIKINILRKLF